MRKASPEPLEKVTLKLFAADVDFLRKAHGWGYSTVVRALVRAHVIAIKQRQKELDDD